MQKEDSNRQSSSKNTMTSLNIHVMGFTPPIKYDDKMHKIILAHQIKENTGLDIKYSKIDYIIGNVWNKLTHNFEPGPGANLIVNKHITQNDINKINNAHTKNHTSGLILVLGHKCKSDYNNNNWYRNDIENRIAFDRFTIPYSLTNTQKINGKPIKYHNNFENNLIKTTGEKTSINIPNKRKFKHNILINLNHKIKHNIQYNKKLNENINNNIINTTNTSIISHPDDTKLNAKSNKKDASIVSNPNDKKLQYNKNEDKNPLEKNNASLAPNHTYKKINSSLKTNKITLKQSLNGTKDCDTLPSTKSLAKSTHSKKCAISNPNGKKLIETLDKNINKNSNTIGIISAQTSTKQYNALSSPKETNTPIEKPETIPNAKTDPTTELSPPKVITDENKKHAALSTSEEIPNNDESLAQNRTYKEINSSLEKHKTSHSNDVSDSTCTKTHSGITTTSSTQNENPNTSIAKAEKIPNDNNNIDNIDANNNTPKPIPNGSNNINDIDENDNTKFTYTAKTGKILYDAISTPKTIPNDNNINDKAENNNIKCDATSQKAISNDNNNVDDKDINNNKKCTELSSPKEILNEDEENKIKYSTLSTPKEIHDNGDANKNINIIPTSPNANIANMRAISGKKWNNQYTKEKLIETSGKTLKLTETLDKKLIETLNSDAISPPKTISNGNILYTLDTG